VSYPKQIDADAVLASGLELLEANPFPEISLRAVAARLGVKAPSLYRYFPDKAALERAILGAVHGLLHERLAEAAAGKDGEEGFRAITLAYLEFARERSQLYFFLTERSAEPDTSTEGKELWRFLLSWVGRLSGDADDTDHAVAVWSFLHGFASLEHAGRFGKSGPRGGFDRGLEALIESMRGGRVLADGAAARGAVTS